MSIMNKIIKKLKDFGIANAEDCLELPNQKFGDIAINCFKIAKEKRKNPNEIAKEIKEIIRFEEIKNINVINGWVNLNIEPKEKINFVIEKLNEIEKNKNKKNKEKILIEHTSINPNADPHVGRARNAIIGDSIARLLSYNYSVERHYYVNDIGKQIAMLALVAKGNEDFSEMLKIYQEASKKIEKDKEFEKKVFDFLVKVEKGDKEAIKKVKQVVGKCVTGQKELLEKINVKFDSFDYESEWLDEAKKILQKFEKERKLIRLSDGRLAFSLEGSGLEKSMKEPLVALTRPNNTTLYLTRDIAYSIWKLKRAKKNIIVLGEDQKLYFKQLSFILKKLGYMPPKVIHYSYVLIETVEGKTKMSTRKGNLVLLRDFFDEVKKNLELENKKRKSNLSKKEIEKLTSNVIRYTIAKVDYNKNVVFNLKKATSLEGDTAIYLNYTLARANSILKKIKINFEEAYKKLIKNKVNKIKDLNGFEERLLHKIFLFPFTFNKANLNYDISIIAKYIYDLCKTFNEFYENCNIANAEKKDKEKRIILLLLFGKIVRHCFYILGLHELKRI